jgi:hypothetical protein
VLQVSFVELEWWFQVIKAAMSRQLSGDLSLGSQKAEKFQSRMHFSQLGSQLGPSGGA